MITLEEAMKIAKSRSENFDTYQEYEDAYAFYVDDGEICDGGGGRFCIIEKASGRIVPFGPYYLTGDHDVVSVGEPVKIKR